MKPFPKLYVVSVVKGPNWFHYRIIAYSEDQALEAAKARYSEGIPSSKEALKKMEIQTVCKGAITIICDEPT